MKKWLASTAIVIALIALPIDKGNAYPGGGGHGGGRSGGGGNFGGGNSGGGNHVGNSGGNPAFSGGGNNSGNPSNGTGHTITKNKSPVSNSLTNNSPSNSSGKIHSNSKNSGGNNHNNSGHYQYTHHKGQSWDPKEWNHAWYRHWYHTQFIWWGGAWIWWDPDVSDWVPYVEGQYIPEDYYAQGDEPPAAGGAAIRIINPADSQATINYSINDYDYQIAPGSEQDLSADQQWVITFNRGENDGDAQYTLSPGDYTFGPSDRGWELYHTSDSVQ
jgi:hypothetical protein